MTLPSRDEFLTDLQGIAEAVKGVPFMPEEWVDAKVQEQIAIFDVFMRGLEALEADAAVGEEQP